MDQDEIRRELSDPEKIAAGIKRFTKDNQFFEDNWAELLAKYPNKWIAILGEELVSADTPEEILERVSKEKYSTMVIKFVDTNPKPFILATAPSPEL